MATQNVVEMAVEIITAQSSQRAMTPEEISSALKTTVNTLKELNAVENGTCEATAGDPAAVTMDPRKSIKKNSIMCMECGQEFKLLTAKHLAMHGMTPDEYRAKYGFKKRQPLSAKALTEARRTAGKSRGLPEALRENIAKKKAARDAKAAAKPAAAKPAAAKPAAPVQRKPAPKPAEAAA